MNIKHSLMAFGAASVIVGLGAVGVNTVSAQTNGSSLVERISERFNINQAEVQTVFDEIKQERQAERNERLSESLQAAVDAETITADQKVLLEEKIAEQKTQKTALKASDLSREEIKVQMQESKQAFRDWADENDINLEALDLGRSGKKSKRGGSFKRNTTTIENIVEQES